MNQIFDVTVKNAGSCPLNNVGLNFDIPEGATITSQWNLLADTRYYLLQNFGPALNQDQTATAGFSLSIDAASFASLSVDVHVYGAACPDSCNNGGSSPSSAPSSAPSSGPSSAPSSAPSSPPTGPAPNCQGNARAVARAQAPWTDAQGYTYQIYDIIANNTGSCPWTTISTYFAGNITQAWNYDIPSGLLSGFGANGVAAGTVFAGAGFIFVTAPTPVAGVPSSPVLARMVNRCGAPCSN